jgi:type IV pilus assembly protein PilM
MAFTRPSHKTIVGLDIEAGSIAATELSPNGTAHVANTAVAPLPTGLFADGEVADVAGLADSLRELFADGNLSKHVRVGLANQRIAVRTLVLPQLADRKALDAAVVFNAQDHIPMPLEQAVLDYQVVEHITDEDGVAQVIVVAVAARRDMVAKALDAVRKAGLRPVGMDLSAFGMIRALRSRGESVEAVGAAAGPARLYCHLGDTMNLAVAEGSSCLFTRVSAYGVEPLAERLVDRARLTPEHAREWLRHVGLGVEESTIEGDSEIVAATREILEEGAQKLAEEIRLSLEFYASQPRARIVEGGVLSGFGSAIPGLSERLASELSMPLDRGRPVALAGMDDADAARLTLSYGLALED